jgi:hypothetical protein
MPKERITSESIDQFDVTVSWNRTGTVQIATTAADADRRLRNWAEVTDMPPPGDHEGTPSAPGTSFKLFDGWHVDLDRDRVNALIRVLRRARDQAFGRDE